MDTDNLGPDNKKKAAEYGYTDIVTVPPPPCPTLELNQQDQMAVIANMICHQNKEKGSQAIWACPGPDQKKIEDGIRFRETVGCEKLFVEAAYGQDNTAQQAKIQEQRLTGLQIKRIATGKVTNPGTKSEQYEVEVWACPAVQTMMPQLLPYPAALPPQAATPPPSVPSTSATPMPDAPTPKPDLLPVAAGAGLIAIIAAVGSALLGGK